LVLESGPEGLWVGLLLLVAPLLALSTGERRPASPSRNELFPVVALLLLVALVLWGNLVLAGAVAAWLGSPGRPRVPAAAGGAWLLLVWRGASRLVPGLLLAAACGLVVPLIALGYEADIGPLAAWGRVASLPGFRLPASSPWVDPGHELRAGRGPTSLLFEEGQRGTAAGACPP